MRIPLLPAALTATTTLLLTVGCASGDSASDAVAKRSGSTITVAAGNDDCILSRDTAGSGTLVFDVTNKGSQVTEFYLYREDGKTIAGEVENIGPGLNRQLVVAAPPGKYVTACKPGMTGDGIRGDFTVTRSAISSSRSDR